MSVLYCIGFVVSQGVVWLLMALPLQKYTASEFIRQQIIREAKSSEASKLRWLFRTYPQLVIVRLGLVFFLSLLSVVLFALLYGPWVSLLTTSLFLLVAAFVSRTTALANLSERILLRNLSYVQIAMRIIGFMTTPFTQVVAKPSYNPSSYEEFVDQLRRLPSSVLSPQQKQRVESILGAQEQIVKDVMTLKKRVISVEPSATLGPIVLSDLQKSGHQYFPVMTKKGEPQGILNLKDLDDIHDVKQRSHVRDIMNEYIVWVEEHESLFALTQRLLKEKQHLMFVRNEDGVFSGVVTVADIIKHLTSITELEEDSTNQGLRKEERIKSVSEKNEAAIAKTND